MAGWRADYGAYVAGLQNDAKLLFNGQVLGSNATQGGQGWAEHRVNIQAAGPGVLLFDDQTGAAGWGSRPVPR